MPQPSVYNVGCTVKYVGSAGTYTPGRYYTCVQDGAGYAWQEAAVIATGLDLTQGSRAVATDANGMAVATDVTAVELGYLGGVTSALQGQLNGKVPTSRTINGKALTDNITLSAGDIGAAPASAVLEASRALQSSSNGEVSVSNVTSVELSYLSGVTSAIQTQLNNKADNADIPTLLSQLTNDTGFVTNAVSDLINYYTKADTYTKTEINNMISAIPKFSIQVVQSLPSTGISTTTIYLVPKTASTNDSYDEYIYVNNTWEKIGSTAVDLEDYYTKAQVNAMVTPVQSTSGITINGVALQAATASQQGLMTVAQVGQLATAVSNAQSALNGNVTGGTFSTDSSGNLTLTLNRTAGALNIGPTALTAAKAVADGSGNNIASTYATQSALSSGLAGKADAGTEITGGAFSTSTAGNIITLSLNLNSQGGTSITIPGVDIPLGESGSYAINVYVNDETRSNANVGCTVQMTGPESNTKITDDSGRCVFFTNTAGTYTFTPYNLSSIYQSESASYSTSTTGATCSISYVPVLDMGGDNAYISFGTSPGGNVDDFSDATYRTLSQSLVTTYRWSGSDYGYIYPQSDTSVINLPSRQGVSSNEAMSARVNRVGSWSINAREFWGISKGNTFNLNMPSGWSVTHDTNLYVSFSAYYGVIYSTSSCPRSSCTLNLVYRLSTSGSISFVSATPASQYVSFTTVDSNADHTISLGGSAIRTYSTYKPI